MLKRLLQVALLSTTNINSFHLEQPKKAQTIENFDLRLQNYTVDYTNTEQWDTHDKLRVYKAHEWGTNDAISAYQYQYHQMIIDNDLNQYKIPTLNTPNDYATLTMLALQINPYVWLAQANETGYLQCFFTISLPYQQNDISLDIRVITSIDADFGTYQDLTSTQLNTKNSLYGIYQTLTDSQNGFIYSESNYTYTTTDTQSGYTEIAYNVSLQVIPNKLNYSYIFIRPYISSQSQNAYEYYTISNYRLIQPAAPHIVGTKVVGNINYEVINIPDVMFSVLTMPFTFVSVAFNLTLFAGTPYQINISNLILSLIAIMVFIFIIRKITGK